MGKFFGLYLKKKSRWGPYFRGLKFLWEKILSLILKKLGLKLKKIGLNKFFWGLIIKHFGPYLLGALGA
jgi:hypothetical protein